jgi:hypothetical protein
MAYKITPTVTIQRLMPDGSWATRHHFYDENAHIKSDGDNTIVLEKARRWLGMWRTNSREDHTLRIHINGSKERVSVTAEDLMHD